MSKKDEVICSANKQLRKLVNVYVMLFIEKKKKKETEKKQKEKKPTILNVHYSLRRSYTEQFETESPMSGEQL